MSKYLSIECEWTEQPLADDLLERQTWGRIQIAAGGRSVSRVWDRESQAERVSLYLPAFPLAAWIVQNWWALLYEPARTAEVVSPDSLLLEPQRAWLRRHCLRSAEAGLMLPRMCVFADGLGVAVAWFADDFDAYPHMPGQFVESGLVRVPTSEAAEGLHAFVSSVVARVSSVSDERAARMAEAWKAITAASSDEVAFCRSAGRLGLDPYRSSQWDPDLVQLLETALGVERPIVADFLEASETADAAETWKWISDAERDQELQRSPQPNHARMSNMNPAAAGYELASRLRTTSDMHDKPLENLEIATNALGLPDFAVENRNHLSSATVRAAVGWSRGKRPTLIGPAPMRETSKRFLQARGLYHAAYACDSGPRLITNAHTWDQQASRAFAAELLAPRVALMDHARSAAGSRDWDDLVKTLADEYLVSEQVIEHQLENAGFSPGVG